MIIKLTRPNCSEMMEFNVENKISILNLIKNNKINIIIPTKIGEVVSKRIDFDELREIIELGKNG